MICLTYLPIKQHFNNRTQVNKKTEIMVNEAITCFSVFRMLFGVFNSILSSQ